MSKKNFNIVIIILIIIIFFSFVLACNNSKVESSSISTSIELTKEIIEVEGNTENKAVEKQDKVNEKIIEESGSNKTTKDVSIVGTVEEYNEKINSQINYEIVHILNVRLDGAVTYYVLIDPIDLSNDYFKEDIKEIIKKIVEEKGRKIDIVIFDNIGSLENGYKDDEYYAVGGLEKFEEWEDWYTDEIINDLAVHCIASFGGENDCDLYFNTLYFFIYSDSVDSGNVETVKYAETIEFNP